VADALDVWNLNSNLPVTESNFVPTTTYRSFNGARQRSGAKSPLTLGHLILS
jgi:hypothetical protein